MRVTVRPTLVLEGEVWGGGTRAAASGAGALEDAEEGLGRLSAS